MGIAASLVVIALLWRGAHQGAAATGGGDAGRDACTHCADAGGSGEGSWVAPAVTPPALAAPSCARCAHGWCQIPAGTFAMGAPQSDPTRAAVAEDPVTVTLTYPFEISQHEVTIAEWTALGIPLSEQPKEPTGCKERGCPVYATWFDALNYANLKSQAHNPPLQPCYELTGCTSFDGGFGRFCTGAVETGPLYACKGYRVPTEAEWEYACRAGTTTSFYDGDFTLSQVAPGVNPTFAFYDEPKLDPIAWYANNSDGGAHAVGGKWPNPWCLYDMLGNMAEWTTGGYNGQSYAATNGPSPQVDPGATLGAFPERAARGGQYFGWPAILDCSARAGWSLRAPIGGVGVRLVRTL